MWIKCSFTIKNIQNSPHEDLIQIINSRYGLLHHMKGFTLMILYSVA